YRVRSSEIGSPAWPTWYVDADASIRVYKSNESFGSVTGRSDPRSFRAAVRVGGAGGGGGDDGGCSPVRRVLSAFSRKIWAAPEPSLKSSRVGPSGPAEMRRGSHPGD